jgi:hypothetical protein
VASVRSDIPKKNGSLSRIMITGVFMVEMVMKALLCDRGKSHNVLLKVCIHTQHVSGSIESNKRKQVAEV